MIALPVSRRCALEILRARGEMEIARCDEQATARGRQVAASLSGNLGCCQGLTGPTSAARDEAIPPAWGSDLP